MGGRGKEFKCQGGCQTDWRQLFWERAFQLNTDHILTSVHGLPLIASGRVEQRGVRPSYTPEHQLWPVSLAVSAPHTPGLGLARNCREERNRAQGCY